MALLSLPSAHPASVLGTHGQATAEAMLAELHGCGLMVAAPTLVLSLSEMWRWMQSAGTAGPRPEPPNLSPLSGLLLTLMGFDVDLRSRGDGEATPPDLAKDFGHVASWLEARGALLSAVAYAEGAARLEPTSARYAVLVARLARERGCLTAAGEWAVWALWLAGRGRDPAGRAATLVELGHLSASRQQYAEAKRLFVLARRFASSRGLPREHGEAIRGLALLSYGHHREDEALELFAQAVKAYGGDTSSVVDLGQLVMGLWLDTREFRGAALLGQVLLACPHRPANALPLAGMLARAAAALRWELTYESACQCALLALGQLLPDQPCAVALLNLVRAHGSLGNWSRAELTADLAKMYAGRTGDIESANLAKRMLAVALRKNRPEPLLAELFPDKTTEEVREGKTYPAGHPVRVLVKSFRAAFRRQGAR